MKSIGKIDRDANMTDINSTVRGADVFYEDTYTLKDIIVDIADKTVTAFIRQFGWGDYTLLRCLNRVNDKVDI